MLANFQGSFKVISCDLFNESFRGILLHVDAYTLIYSVLWYNPPLLSLAVSLFSAPYISRQTEET